MAGRADVSVLLLYGGELVVSIAAPGSKIDRAGLGEVVMSWAAGSVSFIEIRRRLQEEYDLDISVAALHDFVTGQRDSRRAALAAAAASDPVLRERLATSATSDLDMLDTVLGGLYAAYQASHSMDTRVDVARALFDGWRTKARLLGTDGTPTATATVAVIGGRVLSSVSEEELADLLLAARAPEGDALGAGPGASPEVLPQATPGDGNRSHGE